MWHCGSMSTSFAPSPENSFVPNTLTSTRFSMSRSAIAPLAWEVTARPCSVDIEGTLIAVIGVKLVKLTRSTDPYSPLYAKRLPLDVEYNAIGRRRASEATTLCRNTAKFVIVDDDAGTARMVCPFFISMMRTNPSEPVEYATFESAKHSNAVTAPLCVLLDHFFTTCEPSAPSPSEGFGALKFPRTTDSICLSREVSIPCASLNERSSMLLLGDAALREGESFNFSASMPFVAASSSSSSPTNK
mmetsp:Transcript_2910/g.10388  ORF Transcript_2910/g.10388 Transcript_2910/m.10388 type:complete len:245 (-) Transcript_2910:2318-3052(-)